MTTGEDVTKTMEIPLTVKYSYIAKTLNYGMLFAIGFIIFFAWIFIRRRDRRIEVLEEENYELEDEISVLERARVAHALKKEAAKASEKKVVKKSTAKAPTKAEAVKTPTSVTKKPTAKKTPTKKPATKNDSQA